MDLAPEESLGFQVRRCHRAFDRLLNAQLSREGLSSGFWYFLRALWQENGATQKRLAELNNVTEPTTVTTLNAMHRLGLIRRQRRCQPDYRVGSCDPDRTGLHVRSCGEIWPPDRQRDHRA